MSRSLRHRGDIQGLRALAVLLVVLRHAGVEPLAGGFVGVDVFFVVSGFLITGILLAQARETGRISLVDFYTRRARRILPAAALTLVVTEVAACLLLNFVRARDAVWDVLFAAAFAANFRFAEQGSDYFAEADPPSPVLHFWSLGVEEQFYLVWPALLSVALFGTVFSRLRRSLGPWHLRRLLLAIVVLGGASLAWSIHLTRTLPPSAYFSPFTRAWELALGAALAVAASTLVRIPARCRLGMGWLGLGAVVAAAVHFDDATPFPGAWALVPTVGTALMICAGMGTRRPRLGVARLLELAPFRFVGDRSYALYLWHWPVLVIAAQYAERELPVRTNLVLLLGALSLSILSYALYENPIRRAAWNARRSVAALAVTATVVVGAGAVSLDALAAKEARFGSPAYEPGAVGAFPASNVSVRTPTGEARTAASAALPQVVAAVRAARRGDPIPAGLMPPIGMLRNEAQPFFPPPGCVPVAASSQSTSKICPVGRTSSSKTLVVIGDSHAQMWMPAILRLAERDGWRVLPLLRPGCTPDTWLVPRGLAACRPWYRWATAQVGRLRPRVTLVGGAVSGTRGAEARAAERGMLAMARAVKPSSGRVVVIGDAPGLRLNPIDCLLARNASMARCTGTWPAARLRPYDHVASRSRVLGVGFVDTQGWFCFERRCPTVIARTITYRDFRHLTVAYALRLAGTFRAAFRAAADQ